MSEPSAVLRVAIASDNFLTREGLGCLLSGARGIEIVARVDSHPETLTAIRQYRPDVLIVGIRTPRVNAEAALSAAQQLRSQYPNIGVVVIAEAGDGYALELLRSGAAGVGYLLDDRVGDLETLLSAIHGAHAGDTVLDPSITSRSLSHRDGARFRTRRACPGVQDELPDYSGICEEPAEMPAGCGRTCASRIPRAMVNCGRWPQWAPTPKEPAATGTVVTWVSEPSAPTR